MCLGFCLLQAHLGNIPLGQVVDPREHQEWQIVGREALLEMADMVHPWHGSAMFQWFISQPVSDRCVASW